MILRIGRKETDELLCACHATLDGGKKIVVTGHDNPDTDSLISAYMMWELLDRCGVDASIKFCSTPDSVSERISRTVIPEFDRISFGGFDEDDVLLLVDHHYSFSGKPVFAAIDHHTTLPEPAGEMFNLVTKASSCGRIICELMRAAEVLYSSDELLALYSVYIDTVSCKSLKYDRTDDEWAEDIIGKYDIDRVWLEKLGYALNLPDESAESLAVCCYKRYGFGGHLGASSVLQTDIETEKVFDSRIKEITCEIENVMRRENISVWAYVLNNVESTTSRVYFFEMAEEGIRLYDLSVRDRLASRSRDVLPQIKEYLENR